MVEPRLLILLVLLFLKTMYSTLTGPRWLWWEPTASVTTTQRCSIVQQSNRVTLWSHTMFSSLLVRTHNSETPHSRKVAFYSSLQTLSLFVLTRDPCPTVMNPCGRHNGGCQHICVLSHRTDNDGLGYRCKCRHGYDLHSDQRTCYSEFVLSWRRERSITFTRSHVVGCLSLCWVQNE